MMQSEKSRTTIVNGVWKVPNKRKWSWQYLHLPWFYLNQWSNQNKWGFEQHITRTPLNCTAPNGKVFLSRGLWSVCIRNVSICAEILVKCKHFHHFLKFLNVYHSSPPQAIILTRQSMVKEYIYYRDHKFPKLLKK